MEMQRRDVTVRDTKTENLRIVVAQNGKRCWDIRYTSMLGVPKANALANV